MKKCEGNMTKYEGKIKKYEGKMQKYEGNMKKYEGKYEGDMTKYRPQDLEKIRAFLQEGDGKSYANKIPGMAPSTKRESGSPSKKHLDKIKIL